MGVLVGIEVGVAVGLAVSAGVAVGPGVGFGEPGLARLMYANTAATMMITVTMPRAILTVEFISCSSVLVTRVFIILLLDIDYSGFHKQSKLYSAWNSRE